MQKYRWYFQTQGTQVRVVTLALEGAAARWMVTLHSADAPELWNFNYFMMALHCHLAYQKAHDRIRTVKQGCWPVTEYIKEF